MGYDMIGSEVGNGVAGVLALILFAAAYLLDMFTGSKRVPAITALVLAVAGSIMFYGSTWSVTLTGWIGGVITWVFSLFGVDSTPLAFIFSFAFIVMLFIILYDLKSNPWENPASIWSLLLAPVVAHGSGGVVATVTDKFFGGMALALVDAFRSLTGVA